MVTLLSLSHTQLDLDETRTLMEDIGVVIGNQPILSPRWKDNSSMAKLGIGKYSMIGTIQAFLAKPLIGMYLVVTIQEDSPALIMEIKEIDVFNCGSKNALYKHTHYTYSSLHNIICRFFVASWAPNTVQPFLSIERVKSKNV